MEGSWPKLERRTSNKKEERLLRLLNMRPFHLPMWKSGTSVKNTYRMTVLKQRRRSTQTQSWDSHWRFHKVHVYEIWKKKPSSTHIWEMSGRGGFKWIGAHFEFFRCALRGTVEQTNMHTTIELLEDDMVSGEKKRWSVEGRWLRGEPVAYCMKEVFWRSLGFWTWLKNVRMKWRNTERRWRKMRGRKHKHQYQWRWSLEDIQEGMCAWRVSRSDEETDESILGGHEWFSWARWKARFGNWSGQIQIGGGIASAQTG